MIATVHHKTKPCLSVKSADFTHLNCSQFMIKSLGYFQILHSGDHNVLNIKSESQRVSIATDARASSSNLTPY